MSKGKIIKSVADMAAGRDANLAKFLEKSAVKNRVYHGTNADFSKFDPVKLGGATNARTTGLGFFSTDNELVANRFADSQSGANVMPLYVNIQSPLEIGHRTAKERSSGKDPFVAMQEAITKIAGKKSWKDVTPEDVAVWKDRLVNQGYDGIVLRKTIMDGAGGATARTIDDPYHDFYIAFQPEQMKSAIGNRGTYDINDPDITKAKGGPVHKQDGGIMEAIEAAKKSGKPRAKIPLGGRVDIEQMRREVEENARRVAEVRKELAPTETKYSPSLKFLPKGTPESIRYAFEKAAKDAGPSMQVAQVDGKPVGVTSEPGGFGEALSSAGALLDIPSIAAGEEVFTRTGSPALAAAAYTLTDPIGAVMGAPAAGRAAIKGAKALAPKLGETAEQYMFRTGMALPLDVWHGSPHRFPPSPKNPLGQFDPTKIGTGEGAQAYGYGHYFAESPKVAKGYVPRDPAYEDKLMRMYKQAERKQDYATLEVLEDALLHKTPEELRELHPEHGALIDKIASIPQKGSLYKVDLPDEQIAKMLDWDKPLSEQPEIQKALKGTDYEVGISNKEAEKIADMRLRQEADEWAEETGGDPVDYINNANWDKYVDDARKESGNIDSATTGAELHRMIMKDEGYRPQLFDPENYQVPTSEYLRSMGIPGIKYFDAFSRDAGEGTRNFVVFPGGEEMLTIKERMKKGGQVSLDAMRLAVGGGVMSAGQKLAKAFVEAGKKAKLPEQAKEAASKGELFLPDEEVRRMQRELLQGVKKPEELAEGGAATSNEAMLRRERRLGKVDKPVSIPPKQLARGWAAGTLGILGDIESLGRAVIPGVSEDTFLPTSERVLKWIPGAATDEVGQRAAQVGTLFGGAGAGRIANAIRHLPTDVMRAAVEAYGPQATAAHVIKPKGGNWLTGDVEKKLKSLKPKTSGGQEPSEALRQMRETYPVETTHPDLQRRHQPIINQLQKDASLAEWIDKQLTRYVKNDMGTMEDPVRALAEKGVMHYQPQTGYSVAPALRKAAGMPEGNVATTDLGKAWENIADKAILPGTYKTHAPFILKPGYYSSLSELQDVEKGLRQVGGEFAVKNPDTPAYAMNQGVVMDDLGFGHLIDELKNALDPNSGLPRNLQLKPESLSRLSVPQAVERVAKINEWRAAQKAEADLARANNPATVTFKEYPEGYKWAELKMPEANIPQEYEIKAPSGYPNLVGVIDPSTGQSISVGANEDEARRLFKREERIKQLTEALEYEADVMGHCVRGYCPKVESGQSKIYSLRDAKGQPHVTIEVVPSKKFDEDDVITMFPGGVADAMKSGDVGAQKYISRRLSELNNSYRPYEIKQIKGKENAKPADKYLPFVQDFVRSGNWSDVGDFKNTDLYRKSDFIDEFTPEQLDSAGKGEYLTMEEIRNLRKGKQWKPIDTDPDLDINIDNLGMKRGGPVSLDAMRLAVLNKKLRK